MSIECKFSLERGRIYQKSQMQDYNQGERLTIMWGEKLSQSRIKTTEHEAIDVYRTWEISRCKDSLSSQSFVRERVIQ